jgi:hypothetical protein
LVEKSEIPRWLHHRFQESCKFDTGKLSGVKSHDYHIFMERQLCAKEIKKDMMEKLEDEIPVLLCKFGKDIPSRMVQSNATFTCTSSI